MEQKNNRMKDSTDFVFLIRPGERRAKAALYFLAKPVRERMLQLDLLKNITDDSTLYDPDSLFIHIMYSEDENYGIFSEDRCDENFLRFQARTKKSQWVIMSINIKDMIIDSQPRLRDLYRAQRNSMRQDALQCTQRALIISYFLKVQYHRDDFAVPKEWMGMMGAAASSLSIALAAALLPMFLGQSAGSLVLAALVTPSLYFVDRLFLNINEPHYAGVTHLLRWIKPLERFLLSHRASIYLTLALTQPFFYTLGTASLAYAFNLSPLSIVLMSLLTFVLQSVRSIASFSSWADTVGYTPVTQEKFFKPALIFLESLGLIKFTYLIAPAVKACIYGVVMQVIARDYLNFHPVLGWLNFLLGSGQGALTRAYDVNQYFRPFHQEVIRELKIDHKLSRFMNDFWHNLLGNPWIEPVISLRIFAHLFSFNDFLRKLYLTSIFGIHIISGATAGYLMGDAIKHSLQSMNYAVPDGALETVYALVHLLDHGVQAKAKISAGIKELEMGPARHANLPPMRLIERFKFEKTNRGLSITAMAMSLIVTILSDVFLRGLIFPQAFNENLDESLWKRLLFVYVTMITLFSVLDCGLKQCFGPSSAQLSSSSSITRLVPNGQGSVQLSTLSELHDVPDPKVVAALLGVSTRSGLPKSSR